MTIREYLYDAIATVLDSLLDGINDLQVCRESGTGFQLFADENKLFLSGMEETAQYVFADPDVFLAEKNLVGGAFNFDNVGNTFDPMDILKNTIEIHRRRGTLLGIYADIKRLCNTVNVTLRHSSVASNGWILDLSAPNFEFGSEETYIETSLDLILLEQILTDYTMIDTENNSIHSNAEIKKIIKKEFMPLSTVAYVDII